MENEIVEMVEKSVLRTMIECRYCGEMFSWGEIGNHEIKCRKKAFQSLKTLEEKLDFIAREMGLIG